MRPPAGFRGQFRDDDEARAVAVPADADDVACVVRWAADAGHPVIGRGSGSGMAGGAVGDGVVVDLSRLRQLDEPDVERRRIRGDAGVVRGELHRRAASARLRFPVDPSSGEFCTIGGMAATNAAGPHTLRHGSMRPWVLSLDCVFADGSRGTVRRGTPAPDVAPVQRFMRDVHRALLADQPAEHAVLKNSSGYAIGAYAASHDLVDLLVGSEGTLALFTSVEVALIPEVAASASLLVSFRALESAMAGAIAARNAGAAACELLDRTFLTIAARAGTPLPVSGDSEAALLIEVESTSSSAAAAELESIRAALTDLGAHDAIVAVLPADEADLWSFRHAASPAIAKMDPALRSMQFIEDAAVPPAALADYVRGVREILTRNDTLGVVFGHAGDAHVHVNPMVDVRRSDWRARVERILVETTELVARLGGTTSGEHGDGRLRTPLLDRVWSPAARALFARVKRAFDPDGVLNPGVKVPTADQRAIDVVKYDPALAAPPLAAERALRTVEKERGYARFRLDLL